MRTRLVGSGVARATMHHLLQADVMLPPMPWALRPVAKVVAFALRRATLATMPQWMRDYVSESTCRDLTVRGMKFFRADAPRLFAEMMELAKRDIIAYPRSVRK